MGGCEGRTAGPIAVDGAPGQVDGVDVESGSRFQYPLMGFGAMRRPSSLLGSQVAPSTADWLVRKAW